MTFKKYFYGTIGVSLCIILSIITFNLYMNEYGLFGNARGKSIKIWHDERTSKYLLSYNYIPANFEGILIGPSVSVNLNTKKINDFKIYNASLNGGNISELKYIADNIIQRGNLKFIIICLYPYMTKDHGRKTSSIDAREYWGSLGSKQAVELYIDKLFIKLGFRHDRYNDYGHNNYNLIKEKPNMKPPKALPITNNKANPEETANKVETIDEIAYNELVQLVKAARKKGIKIFGFYYPYYIEKYNESALTSYKDKIDKIFTNDDFIWNMNSREYTSFRSDLSNYYDKGHLSWKGAAILLKDINNKLSTFYNQRPKVINEQEII